jgi:hypothetical protein
MRDGGDGMSWATSSEKGAYALESLAAEPPSCCCSQQTTFPTGPSPVSAGARAADRPMNRAARSGACRWLMRVVPIGNGRRDPELRLCGMLDHAAYFEKLIRTVKRRASPIQFAAQGLGNRSAKFIYPPQVRRHSLSQWLILSSERRCRDDPGFPPCERVWMN